MNFYLYLFISLPKNEKEEEEGHAKENGEVGA